MSKSFGHRPRREAEGLCKRSTLRKCADNCVTGVRCDLQKIPPYGPGDFFHGRFVRVKQGGL